MTIPGDCFGRGKEPRKDEGRGLQQDKRENPEFYPLNFEFNGVYDS
jgi:hypothetical protein